MAGKDFTQGAWRPSIPASTATPRQRQPGREEHSADAIEQIAESANQFAEGAPRDRREFAVAGPRGADAKRQREEMTAAIDSLAHSVDNVKENATDANRVANQANQLAVRAAAAVQQSIESMGLIPHQWPQ